MLKRLFTAFVLAGIAVGSASACSIGPHSYYGVTAVTNYWQDKPDLEYKLFRGKVMSLKPIDGRPYRFEATFEILEELGGALEISSPWVTRVRFGNHGGGCGEKLEVGREDNFGVAYTKKSGHVLMTTTGF